MEKFVETISCYIIRFRISIYTPGYGEHCMNFLSCEDLDNFTAFTNLVT